MPLGRLLQFQGDIMKPIRLITAFSLLFIFTGCGSSDEIISAPATPHNTQEQAEVSEPHLKSLFEQVDLVDDQAWGRIVRDNLNNQEFLNLDATSPYHYNDVVLETVPGGDFEGWRVASEAELQALGVAANIVNRSTDAAMVLRAEELRDWFGNVRLSTTHYTTRGLVVDQVDVSEPAGHKQWAFSMGRQLNVEPNAVDFRISGWGPIYSDESTYLVRETTIIAFDIKPGSCPNPINPKSRGRLPVAILGTPNFDVLDIDVTSLLLEGVSPLKSSVKDVTAPFDGDECECAENEPDGYDDLTLKFSTQEVVAALGHVASGDQKALTISGILLDGTPFEASDCVIIVGKQERSYSAKAR